MKTLATHLISVLVAVGITVIFFESRSSRVTKTGSPTPPHPSAGSGQRASTPEEPPFDDAEAPVVEPPSIPAEVLERVDADEQVNIRIYASANRGVVNITTSAASGGFFGDELTGGTGSGLVIDKRGHVLTNFHVIDDADSLRVTFHDGATYDAEIVGADPSNDIAVIRVKAPVDKLSPLPLGESSRLLVGQKVLALGNPFGLERTLTTGIVSSLDRTIKAKNGRSIKGIIQTDAAINPGNSGGPLLNTRGEVIGMNTAILSQVGQSAGIGFAVPINIIKRILPQLIELGRVVRAELGIRRVYRTDRGLLILDLVENGPAERAGLQPIQVIVERIGGFVRRRVDPGTADLIVAIDGKPVRSVEDMLTQIETHAPGEVATVTVMREGKRVDVAVTLGQSSG